MKFKYTSCKEPIEYVLPGGKHSFAHAISSLAIASSFRVENVPNILDSKILISLLENIYDEVTYYVNTACLECGHPKHLDKLTISAETLAKSRNVYCLLPALLNRIKTLELLGTPTGCDIGKRPSDWYFQTLRQFGASVETSDSTLINWDNRRSATISFSYPSMTGTVIALACGMIVGNSQVHNYSEEATVFDQIEVIESLGSSVLVKKRKISILNQPTKNFTRFYCYPDRIQAVTILTAGLLARRCTKVISQKPIRIKKYIRFLNDTGIEVNDEQDSVSVSWDGSYPLKPVKMLVGSDPLYSSDWGPFAIILLATCSQGKSTLIDNVFPERFQFINHIDSSNLQNIKLEQREVDYRTAGVAHVFGEGVINLEGGKTTYCPDIRGTAALLLLTIISTGSISLSETFQLQRGYPDLIGHLKELKLIEVTA